MTDSDPYSMENQRRAIKNFATKNQDWVQMQGGYTDDGGKLKANKSLKSASSYTHENRMDFGSIVRSLKRAIAAQTELIMPDITMCENDVCPMRQGCYRFMAKPDAWQSVATFTPTSDTQCDNFMALKKGRFSHDDS
jgi:hypothetical protein